MIQHALSAAAALIAWQSVEQMSDAHLEAVVKGLDQTRWTHVASGSTDALFADYPSFQRNARGVEGWFYHHETGGDYTLWRFSADCTTGEYRIPTWARYEYGERNPVASGSQVTAQHALPGSLAEFAYDAICDPYALWGTPVR